MNAEEKKMGNKIYERPTFFRFAIKFRLLMRPVFSTPTFYTSFHYTARLLVTVIKAY